MRIVFAKSPFVFAIATLTVVIHMGCGLHVLEQQEAVTAKPQESVLIIVETTDVKNPTLAGSISLPFRVSSNNNVVLSEQYAYVMTVQHLHVINLSNRQHPLLVASMPFPDEVGSARLSGQRLFVAGSRGLYTVDVSNPHHPVLQRTKSTLGTLGRIKAFDVHNGYLYVMDTGDYLHIFNIAAGEARFVEAIAIMSPSSLLTVRAEGASVQQIRSKFTLLPSDIWQELLDRGALLELSGKYKKVRVSEDYLLFASRRYPTRDIMIVGEGSSWVWGVGGGFEHYNMEANYLAYLQTMENKQRNPQKPADVYVSAEGLVIVAQDQGGQTLRVQENLLGPITDFQMSGDFLYVSNSNGFLSIIRRVESHTYRFLSATTLLPYRPISLAVDGNYAGVLCDLSDSE